MYCGRSVFVLPCFGLLYCVCVGRCTDAVLLVRAGLCGTRGASEDGGAHDGGGGGGGLLVPVQSFRIGLCTAAVMLLHCPVYSCCTDSFSTSLCTAAVLICPTSLCIAAVPFLYWPVYCGRSVFVLPCVLLLYWLFSYKLVYCCCTGLSYNLVYC